MGGCNHAELPLLSEPSLTPTDTPTSINSSSPTPTDMPTSIDSSSPTPTDTPTSNDSSSPTPTDTSPFCSYQSVLQNKTEFFSTDAKKNLYVDQLNQAVSDDSSVTVKVIKFAIVDLEKDGTSEVILWLDVNNNDSYGFEILRYQDGTIYGYTIWYRTFMDLKADGTFSFSSGAAGNGFGTVKFTENGYTMDKISYSESSYDSNNNQIISYFVNQESANEDDFLSAIKKQSEKTGATWYEFINDNIESTLS